MFAPMINRLTGGESDKVIWSAEINSECQRRLLSGVISLLKLFPPCVCVSLCAFFFPFRLVLSGCLPTQRADTLHTRRFKSIIR